MPEDQKNKIADNLDRIEADFEVKIIFACESGSRAWGFPSIDSDYDIRFIYVHKRDWYLSINVEELDDVIELPINNNLDFSGWNIRKVFP